jgi:hypothetical protein
MDLAGGPFRTNTKRSKGSKAAQSTIVKTVINNVKDVRKKVKNICHFYTTHTTANT